MVKTHKQELIIFKGKRGKVELRGDFSSETMWATQSDIVDIFGIDQSVVSRHVRNIFTDGEVDQKSNMHKMHTANSDKPVTCYSLDVILAVGYRSNSALAIEFRKWATNTLKDHLVKGYALNEKRLQQLTAEKLEKLKEMIGYITNVRHKELSVDEAEGLLVVIKQYTDTWTTLLTYDEGRLKNKKSNKKGRIPAIDGVYSDIEEFKERLIKVGEASELFARERKNEALAGIFGNIAQSFGGKQMYPSIEEKAAHLLYFVVKNHPFSDGNKRTGAFLFLRFLGRNNYLVDKKGRLKINDAALTALTLLVAESNPKDKEIMIALITNLIS